MKNAISVILALALSVAAYGAPEGEKYTTKYDNVDLKEILKNDRLFNSYYKCVMGKGTCSPDGQLLRGKVRIGKVLFRKYLALHFILKKYVCVSNCMQYSQTIFYYYFFFLIMKITVFIILEYNLFLVFINFHVSYCCPRFHQSQNKATLRQ